MKSAREHIHMDTHAAYREVGSYRAAAEICGRTPKTVRRSVEAARRRGAGVVSVPHNYDGVTNLVAETTARAMGRITAKRLLPVAAAAGSGSARNFRRLVTGSKSQWRSQNHRDGGPGCGLRAAMVVIDWGKIGPLSSSVPWWHGAGCASCPLPTTSERTPP